ncbi:tyrosine-type recombinase/integrase [Tianweitania populi]|uniref:Integrase n=1 Tax=Tianweitania populi TaxID=1607949 RepID=A0A8J3DMS8_9HYPH|nr:site-specific integrase [Tianweitania populi]GHD07734.1 integrase [Tianweitania populi]
MPKLTKSIVDKSQPQDRQYTVWCSEQKGFGVSINPGGSKTYMVDYRTADGNRRRMTIGKHGAITADEARKLAIQTLGGIVLQKQDPLLERRTRRSSLTVADLCDDYLKAAEAGLVLGKGRKPKKATTLYIDRGRIEGHIKPLLGKKLVIDLTRADVTRFIRDVSSGKTAKVAKTDRLRGKSVVEGGAGTAARTAGLLGGILTFAVSEGVIPANPVHGVARPADGSRDRRLTADEFRALGKALDASDDEPWQVTAAIWLLALTGCRRGEIASLRWSEVDTAGNALRLGDTKTGASTRPLPSDAVTVLDGLTRVKDAVHVLPGTRDPSKPFGALQAGIERVMKRAKLEGVTAHTLRHSFASVAADLDYSDSTIGAMLGHAGGTITSKYVHRLDSVLVAAANKVAGEVYRQMTGKEAKVVELRPA